jgi:hypothetical protein
MTEEKSRQPLVFSFRDVRNLVKRTSFVTDDPGKLARMANHETENSNILLQGLGSVS